MLHPEQDELFLADRVVLLDEQVAAAVGVVDLLDAVAGAVALEGGVLLLVGERGGAGELVGDEAEEDRAEPGRAEGGDELAGDRAVGLGDPLGDDPLAGDEVRLGSASGRASGWPGSGSTPRCGAGCRSRARRRGASGSNALAIWRCSSSRRSGVSVAAFSSSNASGVSFQKSRRFSGRASKAELLATVTVRSSSRSARSRIGAGSLTIDGAIWSTSTWRSALVFFWLSRLNSGTLTRSSRSGCWPSR